MIRAWVALWNEEEPPSSMALVRILLGAVVFWDLAQVWRLGLVIPLFAPQEAGGWADIGSRGPPFPYSVLPLEAWVAQGHHGLMLLAAACLTLGWCSRTSALALLLLWSAHWHCVAEADRAVDLLCRDFLGILVLSGAGRTLSRTEAKRRFTVDDHIARFPSPEEGAVLTFSSAQISLFAEAMAKRLIKKGVSRDKPGKPEKPGENLTEPD